MEWFLLKKFDALLGVHLRLSFSGCGLYSWLSNNVSLLLLQVCAVLVDGFAFCAIANTNSCGLKERQQSNGPIEFSWLR
eukprot:67622-Amphidinium_carterae.1